LVELLVVIGIISVLIALLFPAITRARKHVQRVQCASNLRSIGQALTMYTQQYGHYPCMSAYFGPGRWYAIWPTRLRTFLNGEQGAFNCPSQDPQCWWVKGAAPTLASPAATEAQVPFGYDLGEPVLNSEKNYFSYGYNYGGSETVVRSPRDGTAQGLGKLINLHFPPDPESGEIRASRVRVPAQMIAITDSTADGNSDFAIAPRPGYPHLHPGKIHDGGANVLYCDGHVEWHVQSDLVLPTPTDIGPEMTRYIEISRMWNNSNRFYLDR
jgi:prepilin-type processing-associated H-X9-DG protein